MGDYTLCHLHFSLKKETPKEITDIIGRRLSYEPRLSSDLEIIPDFAPCNSAYHNVKSFIDIETKYSEFYGEYECLRINTMFQVKYSRGIYEFVDYISPWVIIDECNRGCIGWTLSEYSYNPSYLFVKNEKDIEDPKDKYIQELENKLKELIEKEQSRDWKE